MAFSKKKKRSGFKTLLIAFFWIILCFVGLVGGAALGYINSSTPFMKSVLNVLPEILRKPDPASHFAMNQVNFLVLGTDVDYDNKDRVIKNQARSDAMFVVRCNFEQGQEGIHAVSIPRDTIVEIPNHGKSKINAAHAIGGPQLSKETVESVLGVHIDEIIVLDFQGFRRLIDALGGMYLHVDKKMDWDDDWGHLHIHFKPGYQWVDGYKAMGFVRFRHSDDDFHRIKRQQEFANSLKARLASQKITNIPNVMQKVRDSIGGTVTNDDQLISLAAWARNLKPNQIVMDTVPVRAINKIDFEIDKEKSDLLLQKLQLVPGYAGVTTSIPNGVTHP